MDALALFTLVRSTLLAGLTDVDVIRIYQGQTVGAPSAPAITMQHIGTKRVGHVKREEMQPVGDGDFTHVETQWLETTLQIGALNAGAIDNCLTASSILQSDAGLAALAVERVRPLRITDLRTVQYVNGADQFEAMPNFDVVLVYPKITVGTTPPAQSIDPNFGRV